MLIDLNELKESKQSISQQFEAIKLDQGEQISGLSEELEKLKIEHRGCEIINQKAETEIKVLKEKLSNLESLNGQNAQESQLEAEEKLKNLQKKFEDEVLKRTQTEETSAQMAIEIETLQKQALSSQEKETVLELQQTKSVVNTKATEVELFQLTQTVTEKSSDIAKLESQNSELEEKLKELQDQLSAESEQSKDQQRDFMQKQRTLKKEKAMTTEAQSSLEREKQELLEKVEKIQDDRYQLKIQF